MKTTEINHLYFKQGDDLHHHLNDTASPIEALEAHAEQLDKAAATLRTIGEILSEAVDIDIQAETHTIMISGPDDVIDGLIAQDLATLMDEEEEYQEDEDDETDDNENDDEEAAEFIDRGTD